MQIKITNQLLHWYNNNKRTLPFRKTNDPYKIWVSEVMLQQTQIKTVIPFYNRWVKEYPTLKSAANANLDKLLKLLSNSLSYSDQFVLFANSPEVMRS